MTKCSKPLLSLSCLNGNLDIHTHTHTVVVTMLKNLVHRTDEKDRMESTELGEQNERRGGQRTETRQILMEQEEEERGREYSASVCLAHSYLALINGTNLS